MRTFVIFFLGLSACTHRHHIAEAHELGGETVTLSTSRGEVEAVGIETPNGVEFQATGTGQIVPANDIDTIETRRHGQGALEGLTWGAVSGAVIGGIYGYSDGDDDCNAENGDLCFLELSAGDKAAFGAIGFGAIGGLIGLIAGAAIGSTDIFEYPTKQAVVKPGGPRGSVAGMTFSF
jgi:hypothetical protein